MPIELTMPRLSDTMEQGTIIQWRVKEGDEVSSGTAVADVETDKATMEMQAYDDGVLARILVPAGKLVPVGTVIAMIAEKGEDPKSVAASAESGGGGGGGGGAAPETKQTAATPKSTGPRSSDAAQGEAAQTASRDESAAAAKARPSSGAAGKGSGEHMAPREEPAQGGHDGAAAEGGLRVSPVARKLADEHGVDLRAIKGRGPGGRVVKEDVLEAVAARGTGIGRGASTPDGRRTESSRSEPTSGGPVGGVAAPAADAATAPASVPSLGSTIPLSGMRLTIAKRLVESKTSIPHYQVSMRLDMDALLSLRETLNEQLSQQGVKLSVNDFLVRACAVAMQRHPEFNASWGGAEGVRVHPRVNIGMAISLPRERGGGLVVGVIRDADRKGLRQISEESKTLSAKARGRGLSAEEMSDSTFTISNLGMFGVEHFTAIINPPNSAILAVGAAVEQPVVRKGQIVVGREMIVTLSLDHRVIDGAMAAEFLQTLKRMVEGPAALLV